MSRSDRRYLTDFSNGKDFGFPEKTGKESRLLRDPERGPSEGCTAPDLFTAFATLFSYLSITTNQYSIFI